MKINIEFDTNENLEKQIQELKDFFNNKNKNPGQQTLNENNKKTLCQKCNIDLYQKYNQEEVKKIINFCNIKYKGKIYCKDCQTKIDGGA